MCASYWFSSPCDDGLIMCLNSGNGGLGRNYYNYNNPGFRPIICLKSGVKAQKSSNVWNLTGVIQ